MKPRVVAFLALSVLFLSHGAVPSGAQCSEDLRSATGEAALAQRAERVNELLNTLRVAYETDNKKEKEMLVSQLDGYAHHHDVTFSQEDQNKMEEIAQRPEVKTVIEALYSQRQAEDMETAHQLNLHADCYFYPNPMLQDYVNKLGQSLVPRASTQFYAFRIVNDPRPNAWSFSTGSIYVSTGLISMVDNEAQLVYVLAHEIGHVERRHEYSRTRNDALEQLLNAEKIASIRKKGAIIGAIAGGVSGAFGGTREGVVGAALGAQFGYNNFFTNWLVNMQRLKLTDWNREQENEADEFAAHATLEHDFDVREAPKVFVALENTIRHDDRVGIGFHYGVVNNLAERRQHVQSLLDGVLKAGIDEKSKAGLAASSPNFALSMAEVKRDNGKLALDYDLFDEARQNLEQAISLRSSDPTAHLYLGEVYKLTARTNDEERKAMDHFIQAIRLDTGRSAYPKPHLERALALLKQNDQTVYPEAQKEIKTYIELYKVDNGGRRPPGMLVLYDYLALTGDDSWSTPPVVNVAQMQSQQVQPANQQVETAKPPVKKPQARKADANKSN